MRVGVAFTPFETRAGTILRLASRADALGLARVDVAEAWTHDATILLAEIAQTTERIGLGASVLSVWGRTPATMALTAAGLQRCSRGRFRLGIGAVSPPLTEGFHGIPWDAPVEQLRRTLTAVRAPSRIVSQNAAIRGMWASRSSWATSVNSQPIMSSANARS